MLDRAILACIDKLLSMMLNRKPIIWTLLCPTERIFVRAAYTLSSPIHNPGAIDLAGNCVDWMERNLEASSSRTDIVLLFKELSKVTFGGSQVPLNKEVKWVHWVVQRKWNG